MEKTNKGIEPKGYLAPIVEIYRLDETKDILCMSNESYDNNFGAGELGGFTDGN